MANHLEDAALLRVWAKQCLAQSTAPGILKTERERLLRMREALLELALTREWLDGNPVPRRMAGEAGLEPATRALTAPCSTD